MSAFLLCASSPWVPTVAQRVYWLYANVPSRLFTETIPGFGMRWSRNNESKAFQKQREKGKGMIE